jgi:glycosyltransferase involved in cell wall biosynthesis
MKILIVHNYYRGRSPGGEDVVVNAERDLLREAGHEVLTYTRSNDEMDEASWFDRVRVAAALQGMTRSRRDLQRLLEEYRPEIVHVHNTFPLIGDSVFELCRSMEVPTVQTLHSFRPSCLATTHYRAGAVCESCGPGHYAAGVENRCYRGSKWASRLVSMAQTRSHLRHRQGRGADRYLLLSEFAARRLIGTALPSERVQVRPNFVTLPTELDPETRALARQRAPYAIFTGKIAAEKGVRTLLGAWRELGDVPLVIVGDGPEMAEIRSQAKQSNLPIEFLGLLPRERALAWVSAAAMQVVPSEWFEGMPLVILEAWALGVPVVASRLGGCAELLGEDTRGLGFRPGDATDLATQVRRLWTNSQLAAELANAGRDQFAAAHTPAQGLRSLLEVYRETMEFARHGR